MRVPELELELEFEFNATAELELELVNRELECSPAAPVAAGGVERAIRQLIIGISHRTSASWWPSEPTRDA